MTTTIRIEFLSGLLFLLLFVLTEAKPALKKLDDDLSERSVTEYLNKYGYLSKVRQQNSKHTYNNGTHATQSPNTTLSKTEELRLAILEFQKFMGIPQTGKLDAATIRLMKKSRCAVPDIYTDEMSKLGLKAFLTTRGQRKRRAAMQFFSRHGYTKPIVYEWFIDYRHRSKKYPRISESIIEYGINLWAAVSNVNFQDTNGWNYADIVFAFYKGDHGDGQPFDGPGGALGHASKEKKQIHFDDEEDWQFHHYHQGHMIRPGRGSDLAQLAAHEMGHVLGLSHSSTNGTVMYPTVDSGVRGAEYALAPEDITRVQAIYGKCWPDRIDAIFSNFRGDGRTYIIVGPLVYQFDNHKLEVVPVSWPRVNYHFWRGGFNLFDDIFHGDSDRLYYFYTEWYYFDFHRWLSPNWWAIDKKSSGINAGIVGWPGIAGKIDRIDAGFKHIDGRVYIFRGDKVFRWDFNAKSPHFPHFPPGHLETGWPKKISEVFPGVPNDIDTAFRWNYDGKVYFFKDYYFYIWNEKLNKAEGVYSTNQWKNVCDVIKCAGAPKCRSWALKSYNCGRMCERSG